MKNLRIGGTIILAVAMFAACKKSSSDNPPNPPGSTGLVRIQQGTDPDLSNDTVYRIAYNDAKKISTLVDSIYNDTLVATYDGSGNLTAVTDKGAYPINATYTYGANNTLTQLDYVLAGSAERYTFEYTGGVVSKKSYYSNLGAGPLQLRGYFTYVVTGGNITLIKAYIAGGIQVAAANLTYGAQTNPFSNLCLFNYGGRLGMDDIAPIEAYFNKNIVASLATSGITATLNNTFDSKQQLGKIVADDQINQWLLTWQFFYK